MANARELKDRIVSISETRKITNAMYLISSSKVKQAKERLKNTEPFFFAMQREISRILSFWPDIDHKYFDERPEIPEEKRNIGLIVITADKGLSGAYNHNILKKFSEIVDHNPGRYKLYVLGEVGRHYFAANKDKYHVEVDMDFRYTVQDPTLHRSRNIARRVIADFEDKKIDEVHIIYTKMESALSQSSEHLKLLPLHKTKFHSGPSALSELPVVEFHSNDNLTFYPSAKDVIDSIAPTYINGIIYGCLVESFCSEHNSRMLAMDHATDSADSMLSDLNMSYNRVRQADITQQIVEVAAGAAAQKRK